MPPLGGSIITITVNPNTNSIHNNLTLTPNHDGSFLERGRRPKGEGVKCRFTRYVVRAPADDRRRRTDQLVARYTDDETTPFVADVALAHTHTHTHNHMVDDPGRQSPLHAAVTTGALLHSLHR